MLGWGFPSGQRGQTVNLLAPPSKVRILLPPLSRSGGTWQTRRIFKNPVRVKSSTGSIPVCGIKGLQLIEVLFSF